MPFSAAAAAELGRQVVHMGQINFSIWHTVLATVGGTLIAAGIVWIKGSGSEPRTSRFGDRVIGTALCVAGLGVIIYLLTLVAAERPPEVVDEQARSEGLMLSTDKATLDTQVMLLPLS